VVAAGGPCVRCRLAPEGSTTAADAHMVKSQCPKCRHQLEQTIGNLKLSEHMRWPRCRVGINIDTNRLANAAGEYKERWGKVPPEITNSFVRPRI
jgi:hypothetical protein